MPFYQNPFTQEFEGNWVLADRHHMPKFVVPPNRGRGDEIVTVHTQGPYNLSGNDDDDNPKNVLKIRFALAANDFKNWTTLSCTITASSLAATTPEEIAGSLNNNAEFSGWFQAVLVNKFDSTNFRLEIKSKQDGTKLKFYILNGQAETVLLFNKKAGVAEIPSYFSRHTVDNDAFEDSVNQLVYLDVDNNNVDAKVVDNAVDGKGNSLNLDSSTVRADYLMLEGRSGQYTFKKNTVDGSDRITQIIEYHAGAKVGDLARLTKYTYTGTNKNPDQATEEPYVLTSSDIVTT